VKDILTKYYIIPILFYALLFTIAYYILFQLGIVSNIPGDKSLNVWDVSFYSSMKNEGYTYIKGKQCNVGFFPLFGYFWKITGVNVLGISLINGLMYLISLSFLSKLLKPTIIQLGFFMSLSNMFFMLSAGTEPLFFVFSTVIIYGLVRNNNKQIFWGILFASLTRASFVFFLPAVIGIQMILNSKKDLISFNFWKETLKYYMSPIILGFLIVGTIQVIQTDKFLGYYEIQSDVWGRKFSFPKLPIGQNSSFLISSISYFNFWIGTLASFIGLTVLINWIKNSTITININKHELFSIIFLTMSYLSIVLFNPQWFWYAPSEYSGTSIIGINRYMQVNAFMLVSIIYLFNQKRMSSKNSLKVLISTLLLWFVMVPNYYKDIESSQKVIVVTFALILYWMYHYFSWKPLAYVIILLSFIIQALLYNSYMEFDMQVD